MKRTMDNNNNNNKLMINNTTTLTTKKYMFCCLLAFSLCLYILLSTLSTTPATIPHNLYPGLNPCAGRYIYVHSLPTKFNSDLLAKCHNLSPWYDMCPSLSNSGLGLPLSDDESIFPSSSWYSTDQFALEIIFHSRMNQYVCRTSNPSLAAAVYVPFYPGLDIVRYLWSADNATTRDSSGEELARWLVSRPEWTRMEGRDHFLVAGRITWDFRRFEGQVPDWGSKLLFMPEVKNMTVLTIEASPWHANDVAIPYPTYFHPRHSSEIFSWQKNVREAERPWLFSFVGAPRPNMTQSIRGLLIKQCQSSERCRHLECRSGDISCHSPSRIMKLFRSSVFCLQPQGDSFTRRSAFDAMVAGCIPVFFHPGTAYVQYTWYLPREYRKYSVFIPEEKVRGGEVRVEEVLRGFSEEEVVKMREEVVRMIPRLVYRDPREIMEGSGVLKDAFDVAVEGVIERVERMRKGRFEGDGDGDERNSWKYNLGWRGGDHEWDPFFLKGNR